MILSRKGYPYALTLKKRTAANGSRVDYWAADSLQAYVTKLYRSAGLKQASSHSGRRTFATRLVARGASAEEVSLLLGHESIDDSMRYIDPIPEIMRRACEDVI
ncbi:tyrosine-type recombinase/integrase [Paraburkholderia sp. BR14263]